MKRKFFFIRYPQHNSKYASWKSASPYGGNIDLDVNAKCESKDVSSTFNVENVISDSVFPKFGLIYVLLKVILTPFHWIDSEE